VIDGHDIRPLLFGGPEAKSPYEAFFYYYMDQLQAVRAGHWKLYLPLESKWHNFRRDGKPAAAELYDLNNDLQETKNLAEAKPEVVERLLAYAERARADLGDANRPGTGQRDPGWVDDPQPLLVQ
jgi:arylsulfatase A